MFKNKTNTDDIDEAALLETFRDVDISTPRKKIEGSSVSMNKEKESTESAKGKDMHMKQNPSIQHSGSGKSVAEMTDEDYLTLFVKESPVVARQGKPVNIRNDYHQNIRKIIQVIGHDSVSISSYIDNVLKLHFEVCAKSISRLYKQNLDDTFFDNEK